MNAYHVDNNGDVRRCAAQKGKCPYGGMENHGATPEETRGKYETLMAEATTEATHRREPQPPARPFSENTYYGLQAPRQVQLEALNAVAQALEEDDATQLVAACGTGKSYMGRQLLHHEMSKENANGISVILTSSIKLAEDTAQDFRPTGHYDQTMGVYGEDYEVIEVHSAVRTSPDVEQTVLADGVINVERIRRKIEKAVEEGKKVVIVATYDSCARVQEAQALLDDARYEADIIMHDEAHNILGQQRPTTVASDANELTAYTGFHNEIPGAIQTRKRLYATASPVLRESPGDAEEPVSLDEAIAIADKMKGKEQWERVTYYSDNPMVGKVSGFISQEEAIEAGCLARPAYAVRESRLKGSLKTFNDPVVNAQGELLERTDSSARHPLSVQTYGAVTATLDALVEDSQPGKNAATNVLAYVGSIPQAEAFKEHFKAVAKAEAGGLDPLTAAKHVDSEDPTLRRRARMAMLAGAADVRAAHSSTDSDSVKERKAAFLMFNGHGVKEGGWSPQRKILANVDIFSEGVSIPEIDAVVISDDEKCSERAMTQAIGRSIRVLPNNGVKTTGHVIIPSVKDSDGIHVNEASVHLAAYGATRVERALVARKLRGEKMTPDDSTTFAVHRADGAVEPKKARSFAQEAAAEVMPLAAAAEAHGAHMFLMRTEDGYREASPTARAGWVRSRVAEKAIEPKINPRERERLQSISAHLERKTSNEIREERRNARVVTSALAVGDVSSLSPALSSKLIEKGVLVTADSVATVPVDEKRAYVRKHEAAIRYALLTNPPGMSDHHRQLQEALPEQVRSDKKAKADSMNLFRKKGGETPATRALGGSFQQLMKEDSFVEAAYQLSQEKDEKRLPLIANAGWASVREDLEAQEEARKQRQAEDAARGEQTYVVNPLAVRKSGELTSATLRALLQA